jgi:hypothetical protein
MGGVPGRKPRGAGGRTREQRPFFRGPGSDAAISLRRGIAGIFSPARFFRFQRTCLRPPQLGHVVGQRKELPLTRHHSFACETRSAGSRVPLWSVQRPPPRSPCVASSQPARAAPFAGKGVSLGRGGCRKSPEKGAAGPAQCPLTNRGERASSRRQRRRQRRGQGVGRSNPGTTRKEAGRAKFGKGVGAEKSEGTLTR